MRRCVASLVFVVLLATGCAGTGTPAGPDVFHDRAAQVAAAWQASTGASRAWRTGFVPLDDLTLPPAQGFPNDDTKQAFAYGWYHSRIALPERMIARGRITFPDGSTMDVPMTSGHTAYAQLDKGDPPCAGYPSIAPPAAGPSGATGVAAPHTCAWLTVTTAHFGSARIRTSRGLATVPAWLFTVAELPAPIIRVAVAESAVSTLPRPSLPPIDPGALAATQKVTGSHDRELSFTVGVGACEGDPAGVAYETADVVVVAATRTDVQHGKPCPDLLKLAPVTVTLAAPLGDRVVLDAVTGQPMPVG